MSKYPPGLYFNFVSEEYVQDAFELETQGFPPDEAATLQTLKYRQQQAPQLFLGAFLSSPTPAQAPLVGFVTSTLTPSPLATHESMSTHVPYAPTVALHSICVSPSHRRRGVATALLLEYIRRAREGLLGPVPERIALLTHDELRPLYEGVGFKWVGESKVQHGARLWYDMVLEIEKPAPDESLDGPAEANAYRGPPTPEPAPQSPLGQADILAALKAPRPPAPAPRLFSTFQETGDELLDEEGTNAHKLVCLQPGCGSLILLAGVASLQPSSSESSYRLDPAGPPRPFFPVTPDTQWWLVTPSPMSFENVAFSRAVPLSSQDSAERARKLLACAECELGPVGWCYDGAGVTEFWLDASRVGYR